MFFNKLSSVVALFALASQVSAHAGFEPVLGVTGKAARADVKRPSTQAPCGSGVNVAQTLAASTPVVAVNGVVTLTATNFNGGKDGSRQIAKLSLDTTGTGTSFTALQASAVTKNGQAAPATTGSEQVTVQLPAGTTCTGAGGTCLLSLTSAGNFGNCVAVTTGSAAAAGAGAAVAAGAGAAAATGTAAAATGTAAAGATDTAAAATDTAAAAGATATTAAGTTTGNGNGQGRGNGRNRGGAGRNRNGAGRGNGKGNGAATATAVATDTAAAAAATETAAAATGTAAAADTATAAVATGTAAATDTATAAAVAATTGTTANQRRFVPVGTRAARALLALEKMEQLQ